MAKLNTTVENIQLKSNMVDADIPNETWTAELYPSAKSLYDAFNRIHPVGSVVCMSENVDPGSASYYGNGTWVLIDKEYSPRFITFESGNGWTPINAEATNTSCCQLAGHGMSLRFYLRLTTAISDLGTNLGTLDLEKIGCSLLPFTQIGLPFTVDGGEVVGNVTIENTGLLTLNDAWNINLTHAIDAQYSVPILATYTIPHERMLDSFCNKFYFKRIA